MYFGLGEACMVGTLMGVWTFSLQLQSSTFFRGIWKPEQCQRGGNLGYPSSWLLKFWGVGVATIGVWKGIGWPDNFCPLSIPFRFPSLLFSYILWLIGVKALWMTSGDEICVAIFIGVPAPTLVVNRCPIFIVPIVPWLLCSRGLRGCLYPHHLPDKSRGRILFFLAERGVELLRVLGVWGSVSYSCHSQVFSGVIGFLVGLIRLTLTAS